MDFRESGTAFRGGLHIEYCQMIPGVCQDVSASSAIPAEFAQRASGFALINQGAHAQPIAVFQLAADMEILQLTDFYQVKVKRESAEVTRIITIPTSGLPEERESAVVNSVIKDKRSFVEYIAFILGDDYLFTLLEESILGKSGFYGDQADRLPALYEKMLKTALEEPARLKEIEYVLKMIHDKDIIPDEFRSLYDTFKATLGLG